MHRLVFVVASLFALGSSVGCGPGTTPPPGRDAGLGTGDAGLDAAHATCTPGMATVLCDVGFSVACAADGTSGERVECATHGGMCVPGVGCAACYPHTGRCTASGESELCRNDGSGYEAPVVCDAAAGESCNRATGRCSSACLAATTSTSNLGCDFWPTPTINAFLHRDVFSFAITIANPNATSITATVTRGASVVEMRDVAPNTLETITLPWIEALEGNGDASFSAIVTDGAYHLTTTLPVTVYQFNALEYSAPSMGAPVYSYSNDASLLLPMHALTGNYIVISRPTNFAETVFHHPTEGDIMTTIRSPGFFAVVAASGRAEVSVHFAANVLASMDGTTVRAYRAGETGSFTLMRGQVLQVLTDQPPTCDRVAMEHQPLTPGAYLDTFYCRVGPEYDLTGTTITSMGTVEVVSGHNCDFVPSTRWACDHLEEVMFPLETWGTEAIVSISLPLRDEPNLARVVSGHDANTITFEPAAVHEPVTLDSGEYIEFEVREHFRASGTAAFEIAQFMVGQDYAGIGTSGMDADGDPSMALVIPSAQYRTDYTFLAPLTYAQSYVNIIAPSTASVMLDGVALDDAALTGGWSAIGSTGMRVGRVAIEGGVHTVTSGSPVGILVYGFGRYTSYMLPGGLDLESINPLI